MSVPTLPAAPRRRARTHPLLLLLVVPFHDLQSFPANGLQVVLFHSFQPMQLWQRHTGAQDARATTDRKPRSNHHPCTFQQL